jgi:cytochrome c-type biogenesis protein CcmH
MRSLSACLVFVLALLSSGPLWAVNPDEMLENPALEERAREISKGIRCVVCQNQDIDSSNAELARDLRLLIRERLVEGDSNDQVESYLVARYGDYVLLKPPFKTSTLLLWLGPFLLLLLGGIASAFYLRRRAAGVEEAATPAPLSAEERAKVQRILDQGGPG